MTTLAVCLLGLWSLSFYTIRMLHQDMERLLGEQQMTTAAIVAAQIDNEINTRFKVMRATAEVVAQAIQQDDATLDNFITQRLALNKLFNGGTAVFNLDGTAIAVTKQALWKIDTQYRKRDAIAAALDGGISMIGSPVSDPELHVNTIVMAVPLHDAQGKIIGAIGGAINLGEPNFLDQITESRYGKSGGYLLLAPLHRLIITATDKNRVMENLPPPGVNPAIDRFMAGNEGSVVFTNPLGIEMMVSLRNIPASGWSLAVGMPTEEAFAPIHDMQQRMLFATLALTLLAGLLTWWILRRQLSPLLTAAETLNNMTAGEQALHPLTVVRNDEIGQLILGFNHLLDSLRQREMELRESEQHYRTLANGGSTLIWTSGTDKLCNYFNEPWLRFTGRTLAQELGNGWAEGVHPDDFEQCLQTYVTAFDRRERFSMDYRIRHVDGSYRWIQDDGDPRYDSQGEFLGYIGFCIDITDRRQAQQALDNFFEQSMNLNLIGGMDGTISRVNTAWENTLGYARDDLQGKSFLDLIHPDDIAATHAEMERLAQGETTLYFENRYRHRNGEYRLLAWSAVVSGEDRLIYAVARDITEQKKIASELAHYRENLEELVRMRTQELEQAKEEAEVANVTKDAFLANMSHELRTPLSAVIGMADLARSISREPKLRDYLDKITASGKHLNRIINDLLDLTKISAGHLEFENIDFNLRGVVERAMALMMPSATDRELQLIESIDDAVPDILLGDPHRIEQILLNLLGNAIKFTPSGRIEVHIALNARRDERVELKIAVTDTGVGMNEDDLQRLFKPFSQVDATVSRKYGGTGLGLTISRQLAQMMGGDITVISREGRGSTFTLQIWLTEGNAAHLADSESDDRVVLPARYENVHVLVAEDQPLNREVVEALLDAVGITHCMAANGQDALDLLAAAGPQAFDLVLMDIQMPVMDGLTATRELRRWEGFAALPVIAMTAHTMSHEKSSGVDAGMNDHIGKPFNNRSFYRTLARWIPRAKQHQKSEMLASDKASPVGLSGLSDLDSASGIARFGGNEARYRHWLNDFVEHSAETMTQIRQKFQAGEKEAARQLAHAFKGRIGMLGMTGLHPRISELEAALKRDEATPDLPALLDQVTQAVTQTREHIRTALDQPEEGAHSDNEPTTARNLDIGSGNAAPDSITHLLTLLDASDGSCATEIARCQMELRDTAWEPLLQKALLQTQNFDFVAARITLSMFSEHSPS